MIVSKSTKSRVVDPKKNIKISGVTIKNGIFVDEQGDIAGRLSQLLPDAEVEPFEIKISITLEEDPEED